MRYFDLHCDTAIVCYKNGIELDDLSLAASVKKGNLFEDWRQCYAVFINDNSPDPKGEYNNIVADFRKKSVGTQKPEPLLTLENGLPIDSLEFIDKLSLDGIKAATLTWNGENHLAGGAYSEAHLKPFGKQVIKKFNDNKIVCDLSHLNRVSFFEVEAKAERVIASHSCCDRTHKNIRNLTDEQIKCIAEHGGIIGLCFYPEFLGTKYVFEGVWRHIYHLLNMGLDKNIAIGSDFDGANMSECLDGVDKVPHLYSYLSERGIPGKTLENIFFNNAKFFFENF